MKLIALLIILLFIIPLVFVAKPVYAAVCSAGWPSNPVASGGGTDGPNNPAHLDIRAQGATLPWSGSAANDGLYIKDDPGTGGDTCLAFAISIRIGATLTGHTRDTWQIKFKIGNEYFALQLVAGPGITYTMKLWYSSDGSTYTLSESFQITGPVSGTDYSGTNIKFRITNGATGPITEQQAEVRMAVREQTLANLGATGKVVSNIVVTTYNSILTNVGPDNTDYRDRFPDSGYTPNYNLDQDIPEFPLGPLIAFLSLFLIYFIIRRNRR